MACTTERTATDPQYFVLHAFLRVLNLSGRDLARKVGVSKTTVARWLHGTDKPSPASAKRLEAFLGQSVDFLLAPASVDPAKPDVVVLFRPRTSCPQCNLKLL